MEIALGQVSAGDPQANGLVENAIRNVQGQFRMIKDALESRRGRRVGGDHPAAPWMMPRVGSVVSRGRKGDEAFTAYRRWKGRDFTEPAAEFGVCVLRTPLPCPSARTSSTSDGSRGRWRSGEGGRLHEKTRKLRRTSTSSEVHRGSRTQEQDEDLKQSQRCDCRPTQQSSWR